MAHRCTHMGASVFDRRQKFCDSASRLDRLAKLSSRSNGLEGQTEPEMKTATHGPDEGRLDLQKSVLISRRQKFCESATARPYDGDVKWGQRLPNSRFCSFSAVFKQIRYFASMLKLAVARCIVTCTCVRLLPPFFHCPLFASGHVMQGMQVYQLGI